MATVKTVVQHLVDGKVVANNSQTRTRTANHRDQKVVTVTQSGEFTLTFSADIVNAREVVITNNDATNYFDVGFATAVYYIRVYPGQTEKFSVVPSQAALYMLANTADCEAEVVVEED